MRPHGVVSTRMLGYSSASSASGATSFGFLACAYCLDSILDVFLDYRRPALRLDVAPAALLGARSFATARRHRELDWYWQGKRADVDADRKSVV